MWNSSGWSRRGYRFFRVHFAFFGPGSCCWISLFPLDVWHLAERVFFAGHAKQQQAESHTHQAPAQENSHNAVPQLSASLVTCKLKAHDSSAILIGIKDGSCSGVCVKRRRSPQRGPLQMIERCSQRITIRRGGPHRQTERLERSLRSHSAFCRHLVVFCADFVHAKRRTILDLV